MKRTYQIATISKFYHCPVCNGMHFHWDTWGTIPNYCTKNGCDLRPFINSDRTGYEVNGKPIEMVDCTCGHRTITTELDETHPVYRLVKI